jgi:hypothetical protein
VLFNFPAFDLGAGVILTKRDALHALVMLGTDTPTRNKPMPERVSITLYRVD